MVNFSMDGGSKRTYIGLLICEIKPKLIVALFHSQPKHHSFFVKYSTGKVGMLSEIAHPGSESAVPSDLHARACFCKDRREIQCGRRILKEIAPYGCRAAEHFPVLSDFQMVRSQRPNQPKGPKYFARL